MLQQPQCAAAGIWCALDLNWLDKLPAAGPGAPRRQEPGGRGRCRRSRPSGCSQALQLCRPGAASCRAAHHQGMCESGRLARQRQRPRVAATCTCRRFVSTTSISAHGRAWALAIAAPPTSHCRPFAFMYGQALGSSRRARAEPHKTAHTRDVCARKGGGPTASSRVGGHSERGGSRPKERARP